METAKKSLSFEIIVSRWQHTPQITRYAAVVFLALSEIILLFIFDNLHIKFDDIELAFILTPVLALAIFFWDPVTDFILLLYNWALVFLFPLHYTSSIDIQEAVLVALEMILVYALLTSVRKQYKDVIGLAHRSRLSNEKLYLLEQQFISQARVHQELLSHLPVCIAYLDANLNFTYFNDAWRAHSVLPGIEAIDKNLADFITDGDCKVWQHAIRAGEPLIWSDQSFLLDLKLDKAQRFWNSAVIPIPEETGVSSGCIVITQEITSLVQKQALTREKLNRQDALLSCLADGVIYCDNEGKILLCNKQMASFAGLTKELVEGSSVDKIISYLPVITDDAEKFRDDLREDVLHVSELPTRLVILDRPQPRELMLLLFPVKNVLGVQIGIGAIARDVTSEQEISRMKSDFVAIASHELRTPVTAAVGFVELLQEREVSEEKRKLYLNQIQQQLQRLAGIIEDLLNISRIESGGVQLDLQEVSPKEIVKMATVATWASKSPSSSHHLVVKCEDRLPAVLADPIRAAEVLENLLSNSIKYSPQGGTITVEASFSEEQTFIQFSVADTGIGIAKAEQERLFTPFYRAESHRVHGIAGSGLGLSIVKGLVEMHGGKLWFESVEGVGTTMYFTLPIAQISCDPPRTSDEKQYSLVGVYSNSAKSE